MKSNIETKMQNSYIERNNYVHSLPRYKSSHTITNKKKFAPDSVLFLIIKKVYSHYMGLKSYMVELCLCFKEFNKTLKLKGSKKEVKLLLIGNGPSQDFLSLELLENFKISGGEIIAVNYWTENSRLSSVKPNYLLVSDPLTLSRSNNSSRDQRLSLYLQESREIKIICPFRRVKELGLKYGHGRVFGISDSEIRGALGGISPVRPRRYVSMSLYKALAFAVWLDYSRIYIIGMDNTYPRNLFSDFQNSILDLQDHAGTGETFVSDISNHYQNIAAYLFETSLLFHDLFLFKSEKIINLDPYSLTDAFQKIHNVSEINKEVLN